MTIEWKVTEKTVVIQDEMKGRLLALRIVSTIVLLAGAAKLSMLNWSQLVEFDYLFIIVELLFVYFCFVNFFVKTSKSVIPLSDIKYFRSSKGGRKKAYLKLKNQKTREFTTLTDPVKRQAIEQMFIKIGVKIV